MSGPELIISVALVVFLAADVAFIALSHAWTSWRSNPWGRHVMLFSYALAGVAVLSLARLLFGDYPHRECLLAAFFSLTAGAMVQRVWLLVREHRGRRR